KRVFLVILFTSFSGSLVSRIPGAVHNDDELTPDIRSHDEGKEKEINCDKLPSNLASLKITVQKV
ncbi:hypothetical protein, partial [Escherichia coli]|uniref:hypothetical protein n=1 Tax=Escherichia coli TaxID=562 RepID=UPI001BC83F58